jgi:hypothetical protein
MASSTTRMGFWKVWLVTFLALVVLMEVWSLATPWNGGPDEARHLIKAASVVRGQWLGPKPADQSSDAFTVVHIPNVYAHPDRTDCVIKRPTVPEGTCPTLPTSSKTIAAETYVGHYPPLYYLLIGWPTFLKTVSSIYLVLLMSVIVDAAMLALAFASAWRWSRSKLLPAGLAIAATPTVMFLAGVVNPSGLEICAAITMWATATILVVDHPVEPPTGLLATLTVSVSVLVLVRGLSPLWPALCAIILAPLAWNRLQLRRIIRRRDARIGLVVIVASALLGLAWIIIGHALAVVAEGVPRPGTPETAIVRVALGSTGSLINETIFGIGWLDVPAPVLTIYIWIGVTGATVLTAVLLGCRKVLFSLALAVALSVLVPFILIVATARHSGFIQQGRYFMPLVVSVPILATAASNQVGLPRRAATRLTLAIALLTSLGQIAAGTWALHRYLVGIHGPILPTAVVPGVWHPPLPGWLLDLGFVAGSVALAAVVILISARIRGVPDNPERPVRLIDAMPPDTLELSANRPPGDSS